MQPGKKSKKIGISFSIFFCRGLKSAPWKNGFFRSLFDPWPLKMKFFKYFFQSKLVVLVKSKKKAYKNCCTPIFGGHLNVFTEKHQKNADLFFLSEMGGRWVGVLFFQKKNWSVLDRPKLKFKFGANIKFHHW